MVALMEKLQRGCNIQRAHAARLQILNDKHFANACLGDR
jgi:hypothetical protein